ncbi:MAG TPA: ABC transporter substrate-binding protein [Microbacteriaceae bacterium]|nr:ABC transporter substrate-binding protein [Microbacteriaceae bacterium]
MSLRTKTAAVAALAAAAALALSACTSAPAPTTEPTSAPAADAPTIRIGQLNSYTTLTISKDLGLATALPDGAAEIAWSTGFPAFVPALEAVNAGEIDVSSGGGTNFFTGLAAGGDYLAIGIENGSSGVSSGIVASEASGIKTIEDLKGHTIAVNQGGTGHYLALRALDKAGIDPSEVTLEFLPPADGIAAFQSGAVDAIAIWDQYFATAQLQPGAVVVANGEDLDSLNIVFHFVTRSFYEQHPEAVAAFIRALSDVSAQTTANPQLVLDFYAGLGAGEDVLEVIAQWPPYQFQPIGQEQIDLLTQHGKDLLRYGLITEIPDISDAFVVTE